MNVALTKMTMRGQPLDHRALKRKLLETGPLIPRLPPKVSRAEKIARAIKILGKKYVCHKSNRIAKLPEPLPDNFVLPGRKK